MEKTYYLSPIGLMEICGSDKGISSVKFVAYLNERVYFPETLAECVKQLNEYFIGERKTFDLKLDIQGSEFQKKVWVKVAKIPFGKIKTYHDIAASVKDVGAVRAVGGANAKNKVAIIIPCHRVVGQDGNLTGYAGGIWRKQWLLEFESINKQGKLF
jgi:methylated-DNA-[protein]-cysteine S-methyltransferase